MTNPETHNPVNFLPAPEASGLVSTDKPAIMKHQEEVRDAFQNPETQRFLRLSAIGGVLPAEAVPFPTATEDDLRFTLNSEEREAKSPDYDPFLHFDAEPSKTESPFKPRKISEIIESIKADRASMEKGELENDRTMVQDSEEGRDAHLNEFADRLAFSGLSDDLILDAVFNGNKLGHDLSEAEQVMVFDRIAAVQEELNDGLSDLKDANITLHNLIEEHISKGNSLISFFTTEEGEGVPTETYLDYDRQITEIVNAASNPALSARLKKLAQSGLQSTVDTFRKVEAPRPADADENALEATEERGAEPALENEIQPEEEATVEEPTEEPAAIEIIDGYDEIDSEDAESTRLRHERDAEKQRERVNNYLLKLEEEFPKVQDRLNRIRLDAAGAALRQAKDRSRIQVDFFSTEEGLLYKDALARVADQTYIDNSPSDAFKGATFEERAALSLEDPRVAELAGPQYIDGVKLEAHKLRRIIDSAQKPKLRQRLADLLFRR